MSNIDEAELLAAPKFTAGPSTEQSLQLTLMANELADVDAKISDLEIELELAKKRKIAITREELPAFLNIIGQDRVGLPDRDMDLVLEAYYHANIMAEWPEEQREAAFDWLEKNGHGDLIKITLSYAFPRTAFSLAKWVMEQIAKIKIPAIFKKQVVPDAKLAKGVAWNTLTAFVKEQIEAGEELPLEVLGATVGTVVKIKPRNSKPKGKK